MSEREGSGSAFGILQVLVTFVVATMVAQKVMESGGPITIPQGVVAAGAMTLVGIASIGLWAWRRRRTAGGITTGQMVAARLEEVERREAEADAVHARLAELEERLDFSERLLAQGREEAHQAQRASK